MLLIFAWTMGAPLFAGEEPTEEDPWDRARRGGVVLLMRHAQTGASGRGPMDLEDRGTQRLLSPDGERQAAQIGRVLSEEGVDTGVVRSSRLFRARDTARLAFGEYETWDVLDALDGPGGPPPAERDRQLKELFAGIEGEGNVVLVTHSPNVSQIIGIGAGEGWVFVLEPDGEGGFRLVGRLDIEAKVRERGQNGP
ncbi:MAG: histidine phosphatase family protein [Kiritimatiellae bacterium]|nr:histidine phosphatase family protein [Kiritimatiellia bacterium]